jgi:carboxyl-terminal processing protease
MRTPRTVALALLVGAAPLSAQDASLLAVYDTAWDAIARTFYDTALVNGRWRSVADSIRGTLGAEPSEAQVRRAIRAMIAVPGQSHFALITSDALPRARGGSASDGPPGTAGVTVRLAGDTLIVWRVQPGGPAEAAGIRPGDAIERVDDNTVAMIRERIATAFPGNPREANSLLLQVFSSVVDGAAGSTVDVELRRLDGTTASHTLTRVAKSGRLQNYGNLPPMVIQATLDTTRVRAGNADIAIPVIGFSGWFPVITADLDRFAFGARNAPAVIIDLRGNLGGVVGIIGGFAGHFSDSTWSLGSMRGRGATLRLAANPRRATSAGERVDVIRAPVAILIDPLTASSSEFFAAGMQALGRARVFGEASAGQSLPAAMKRLPNGDVLMHAIADHEDALGRRIEGIGVQPDTSTPLTRSDLAAGRDVALDAARRWLADTLSRR